MFADRFQHLAEIERRRIVMPEGVRLRLNRLEKPEPWPESLQATIADAALWQVAREIQQYPDYQPFYDRLSRFINVPASQIVVGAGIEEFIRALMLICADPGEKVAVLWPTCAMFEIYARAFNLDLVRIIPDPAAPMTADDLIAQLPSDLRLLLLANPGQPVETCFGHADLSRIADACQQRDAVFAVDEAYHGFGAPSAMYPPPRFGNVAVLRTFSKAFGAAGLRLGYAAGSPNVVAALNAVRQSGEVSSFSMAAATILMDNYVEYVRPSVIAICAGRDALRDRVMTELGLQAWGRWANHVLIDLGDTATRDRVGAALEARGVLTKANFPAPLDRHMLVTAGPPEMMDEFFVELRAAL